MNKKQETKEKMCAFYASDYHFEMISLPYIDKNLEKNKEIVVLTENNLEETMKNLISKMNLREEKKRNIFKIDWNNDDLSKFKKIKQHVENEKDMIIFIKGKENYIRNINKNIEKWIQEKDNVKIIDCYDMEEVTENLDDIMGQYKKILNTTGEKEISKI
ncbi:MAG: hypothetical protein HFJ37_05020 [Clostridia bacterium]|nr:hypothetical protein [Clostridia bacterium]